MPKKKKLELKYFSEKEAKKIEATLLRVKELIQEGKSLPQAFAIAAKENDLNKDELHILVRAWNVGSFREKYEETRGKPVEERAGEYPVIDYEEVIIFYQEPLGEKKKASYTVSSVVENPINEDNTTALPPDNYHDPWTKYAGLLTDLEIDGFIKEGKQKVEKLYKEAKEVLEQLNIRKGYLQAALEDELKLGVDSLKYGDFDSKVVIENLSCIDPLAARIAKQAAGDLSAYDAYKTHKKLAFDRSIPPYCHFLKSASLKRELNEINGLLADVKTLYDKLDLFIKSSFFPFKKKAIKYAQHQFGSQQPVLTGFWPGDIYLVAERLMSEERERGSKIEEKADERLKRWYETQKKLDEYVASLEEKLQRKVNNIFDSPKLKHDLFALKGLRFASKAKLLDPLLSGYDLKSIFNAYISLKNFAPNAMDYDSVALSFIKKFLEQEGRLDSFDLKQLNEIDRNISIQRGARAKAPPVVLL